MSDRWKRVEDLYHRAGGIDPAARSAFLDEACADDPDLRREVDSLIAERSRPGFMDAPAIDAAAREMAGEGAPVAAGQRFGHYTIRALIGKGGMGEVYRADDGKLGREVAVKVLPSSFALDPDRVARFDREARLLATLNHPNIATIHGLEESAGRKFLVLELVEGETLAERLKRGAIPLDEALKLALQIAEALEAADEKGIVHRDLKPANVKVTPEGRVKVLDFGLAKAFTGTGGAADLSQSPTLTIEGTQPGVLLGTAAYMAPEQAKGRTVDRRADIFAFGCVLYEMLAGRPAFGGEDVPEILSRVLQREPDWTLLPRRVPPSIHRLLRLCLEKDPRKRRQAAGDVRIDLEQALSEPAAESAPGPAAFGRRSGLSRLAWIANGVVLIALAIPAAMHLRETPRPERRLEIVPPPTLDILSFELSPDGQYIVYAASGSSGDAPERLYLRRMDETVSRPIPGTEDARLPFWSPDSRSVGFFASGQLWHMDIITGGPPTRLAAAVNPLGGDWGADGTILFAPTTVTPLLRVPASGGEAVPATELDARQSNHRRPSFLPDGRRFLFYVAGEPEVSGIYLGSLDGGAPERLTGADSVGEYLTPDRVIFVQDGALVARRLDASRMELTGDPVTLAAPPAGSSVGGFSVSATGVLAYRYRTGSASQLPVWRDRTGTASEPLSNHGLNAPELSPDGRYVAYDNTVDGNRDVWILDLVRGGETPFTRHERVDGFPVWSQDASRVVFHSQRNGTFDIWIKPFGGAGAEQLLYGTPDNEWALDWSDDDRFLLYRRTDSEYTSSDLLALPMTGDDRTPIVVADSPAEERMGEFSPDGRWVAYDTDESGRREIIVQAFPESRGSFPVSINGGAAPRWNADQTEIYFIAPDGTMMAVPVVTTDSTFEADRPVPLFPTPIREQEFRPLYAVSRDGRFLVSSRLLAEEASSPSPIEVILDWEP